MFATWALLFSFCCSSSSVHFGIIGRPHKFLWLSRVKTTSQTGRRSLTGRRPLLSTRSSATSRIRLQVKGSRHAVATIHRSTCLSLVKSKWQRKSGACWKALCDTPSKTSSSHQGVSVATKMLKSPVTTAGMRTMWRRRTVTRKDEIKLQQFAVPFVGAIRNEFDMHPCRRRQLDWGVYVHNRDFTFVQSQLRNKSSICSCSETCRDSSPYNGDHAFIRVLRCQPPGRGIQLQNIRVDGALWCHPLQAVVRPV